MAGNDDDLLKIPEGVETSDSMPSDAEETANSEAAQLGSGLSSSRLQRLAENAEHDRSEKFKNHFERIAVICLYGIAILFAVLAGIWFWHLITPPHLRWLSSEEISRLQNFVTGGIIATIAGGHIKKRIG